MTRVRAALATVLILAIAACGIPADDGPRAISRDEELPAGETTATSADGQTERAVLYFYDGQRDNLVPVTRDVVAGGAPTPSPATVLGNLLDGVMETDQPSEGVDIDTIVTRIPAETALASQPVLENGTLTIDLSRAINTAQSDGASLAFGQLVCTAAALDEVRDVRFTVEGEPVGAPAGDGVNRLDPLTCEDYGRLVRPID